MKGHRSQHQHHCAHTNKITATITLQNTNRKMSTSYMFGSRWLRYPWNAFCLFKNIMYAVFIPLLFIWGIYLLNAALVFATVGKESTTRIEDVFWFCLCFIIMFLGWVTYMWRLKDILFRHRDNSNLLDRDPRVLIDSGAFFLRRNSGTTGKMLAIPFALVMLGSMVALAVRFWLWSVELTPPGRQLTSLGTIDAGFAALTFAFLFANNLVWATLFVCYNLYAGWRATVIPAPAVSSTPTVTYGPLRLWDFTRYFW